MIDTTHAHAISDEGVAFLADALPNSTEGVAFSAAFQAKGLHFRPLPARADAISDEGVAFSADSLPISDEGGLHFRPHIKRKGCTFDHWHGGGVHF